MRPTELFSLEALEAMEGDALLLHYGSAAAPRLILIDGGPKGVYRATLRGRLARIGEALGASPLELRHVFVTHLDSDHIRGVLDLATAMLEDDDCPAECSSFWLNSFGGKLLAKLPAAARAALDDSPAPSTAAVTASVKEGQALADALTRLAVRPNQDEPVLVADGRAIPLDLGEPELRVQLVCPDLAHLRRLEEEWRKKATPTPAEKADYADTSVYNLSSLVLVVEAVHADGRPGSMLLTGDARGDHILAGLADAGMLDAAGGASFDVLKVPHHGSDRTLEAAFFEAIQARHYVISANGRHENPSADTLRWIAAGARDPDYRVWLTNRSNPREASLEGNVAAALQTHPDLAKHLRFREDDAPSVVVDVFGKVQY